MLEKIRKPSRAKSFIAYIIFGLICLVFVFLGMPVDSPSGGGYVAIVNKEIISVVDFKQSLERTKSSMNSSSGERQKENQRLVLNQLINSEIVFQTAQKSGLIISDHELRDQIASFEAFQEDGKFKNSLYQTYLDYQRISPKVFEDRIRKWILSARAEKLFDWALNVSKLEEEKNRELNRVQFKLKFVRISLVQSDSSEEIKEWQRLLSTPKELNKVLKSKGLQWVDTPVISLGNWARVLPGVVDEDELFENVLEKIPDMGLIPKLMMDGENIIVVRLENFEVEKPKSLDTKPLNWDQSILSLSIARMAFSSWLQFMRDQSRIKINSQFI